MGTTATTLVYNDKNQCIIDFRTSFDGYPSGYGLELAKFLLSIYEVTNGIDVKETRKTANGMECLAAQLVAFFKTEVGDYYLHPPSFESNFSSDYNYIIHPKNKISVELRYDKKLFKGTWKDFYDFCLEDD